MGRAIPPVGLQRGGHFGDPHAPQRRLHHNLAREFHPRRAQVHPCERVFAEPPQATVKIPDRGIEEQPPYKTQHRIPQIAVQGRHGPRRYAAAKAIPHYQVVAFSEFLDERPQIREIVAVVGIPHDDVGALGGLDAAAQGRAIAPGRHRHHPRTVSLRNLLGTVRAAVVGNHHLPIHPQPLETAPRLVDADSQRARLVQARHDDTDFNSAHGWVRPWLGVSRTIGWNEPLGPTPAMF